MTTESLHAPTPSRRRSNPTTIDRDNPPTRLSELPEVAAVEQLEAQRLVCRHLVEGCEDSLARLRGSLREAKTPAEVRIGLEAVDLLESVMTDWRETWADIEAARPD